METTAARRPPANDEGVCGMFINLFRRQRPALARLARNSNAYRQPMVASVSSSAVGHEPPDRLPHRIRAVDRPNPQRRLRDSAR